MSCSRARLYFPQVTRPKTHADRLITWWCRYDSIHPLTSHQPSKMDFSQHERDHSTSEHHDLARPAWFDYPLPFMVVVHDSSFVISPTVTPSSESTATHKRSNSTTSKPTTQCTPDPQRSKACDPKLEDTLNLAQSISSLEVSTESSDVYPEIRYVFSDDDFAPTIDVLDSRQGDVSLIIDFDESGAQVVNATSLSSTWQISSVKEKVSSGAPAPAWAANDSMDATVAHVLYVNGTGSNPQFKTGPSLPQLPSQSVVSDGYSDASGKLVPSKNSQNLTRKNSQKSHYSNRPPLLPSDLQPHSSNNAVNQTSTNLALSDVMQQLTVRALTKQFLERNKQLRQIIDSISKENDMPSIDMNQQ